MDGISTSAPLKLANNYKYNGKELNHKEFSDGTGLEWYDYGFRNYDAQIGRFTEQDPLTDGLATVSPYQYALNDPISNIDKDGLMPTSLLCPGSSGFAVFVAKAGAAISNIARIASPAEKAVSISAHALQVAGTVGSVIAFNDEINNFFTVQGVGISPDNNEIINKNYDINDVSLMNDQASLHKDSFPSFKKLLSNYPLPYDHRPDRTPINPNRPLNDITGDNFLYFNQCAIRVSIALRKSGVSLKGAENYTNPGGNPYGNGNILGATNLARFLGDKYLGVPEKYDGTKQNVFQSVLNRQGIIYFQGIIEGGRRSERNTHIELWDKNHYMSNFSFKQMFGGTTIWFWPLK